MKIIHTIKSANRIKKELAYYLGIAIGGSNFQPKNHTGISEREQSSYNDNNIMTTYTILTHQCMHEDKIHTF